MYHKGGRDCALLYFISKIAKNCYPQKCPSKKHARKFLYLATDHTCRKADTWNPIDGCVEPEIYEA